MRLVSAVNNFGTAVLDKSTQHTRPWVCRAIVIMVPVGWVGKIYPKAAKFPSVAYLKARPLEWIVRR